MCTGDTRETIIQQASGEIREYTGTPAYDLTYSDLCSAGAGVRIGIEFDDALLVARHARHLILGLAAWDRGYYPAERQIPLTQLAEGQRAEAARKLIDAVRAYEWVGSRDRAQAPIGESMDMIGVTNSVVVASKLLHFLSPGYLPILDQKVNELLGNGRQQPTPEDYQCYAADLRELGITGHGPDGPHDSVQAFGDRTVIAQRRLRRVDCTLWARAPR